MQVHLSIFDKTVLMLIVIVDVKGQWQQGQSAFESVVHVDLCPMMINDNVGLSGIDRDPGKIPVPVKIGLFAGIPVPVKIVKFTGILTGILISNFWKIQFKFLEFSDIFYKIFHT